MFFLLNDTATTEIYTLSLHGALPISRWPPLWPSWFWPMRCSGAILVRGTMSPVRTAPAELTAGDSALRTQYLARSEEHTSELQSRQYLVCRLLLEKNNGGLVSHHVQQ